MNIILEHLFTEVKVSAVQLCLTLCDPMDCSPQGSSVHGDSPGKNTGVGCHALLQGIFPTQGLNLVSSLQADSLLSEPPGKPTSSISQFSSPLAHQKKQTNKKKQPTKTKISFLFLGKSFLLGED